MGLIERYGSGIHRILDDCREASVPAPVLENAFDGFRALFQMAEQPEKSQPAAEKTGAISGVLSGALKQQVIQLISENPRIQRKTIADRTGDPERTVDRCIAECIEENKIERRGSKKAGTYWLMKKD